MNGWKAAAGRARVTTNIPTVTRMTRGNTSGVRGGLVMVTISKTNRRESASSEWAASTADYRLRGWWEQRPGSEVGIPLMAKLMARRGYTSPQLFPGPSKDRILRILQSYLVLITRKRCFNFWRHIDVICIIVSAPLLIIPCSHIMRVQASGQWSLIWKSGHSSDHAILILSPPRAHLQIVEIGQYLDWEFVDTGLRDRYLSAGKYQFEILCKMSTFERRSFF